MNFTQATDKLQEYTGLIGTSNGHEEFPYTIERLFLLPPGHEKFDGLIYHMVHKNYSNKTALEIFGEINADLEVYVYANRMVYLADDYTTFR